MLVPILLASLFATSSLACNCTDQLSLEEGFCDYDFGFKCLVLDNGAEQLFEDQDQIKYKKFEIQIIKSFRNVLINDTKFILTPTQQQDCGLPLLQQQQWYLFGDYDQSSEVAIVTSCDFATQQLSEPETEFLSENKTQCLAMGSDFSEGKLRNKDSFVFSRKPNKKPNKKPKQEPVDSPKYGGGRPGNNNRPPWADSEPEYPVWSQTRPRPTRQTTTPEPESESWNNWNQRPRPQNRPQNGRPIWEFPGPDSEPESSNQNNRPPWLVDNEPSTTRPSNNGYRPPWLPEPEPESNNNRPQNNRPPWLPESEPERTTRAPARPENQPWPQRPQRPWTRPEPAWQEPLEEPSTPEQSWNNWSQNRPQIPQIWQAEPEQSQRPPRPNNRPPWSSIGEPDGEPQRPTTRPTTPEAENGPEPEWPNWWKPRPERPNRPNSNWNQNAEPEAEFSDWTQNNRPQNQNRPQNNRPNWSSQAEYQNGQNGWPVVGSNWPQRAPGKAKPGKQQANWFGDKNNEIKEIKEQQIE